MKKLRKVKDGNQNKKMSKNQIILLFKQGGDYEKAMENLKEDLKLAETGSRVDISHNGKVIYSETKKQYKKKQTKTKQYKKKQPGV